MRKKMTGDIENRRLRLRWKKLSKARRRVIAGGILAAAVGVTGGCIVWFTFRGKMNARMDITQTAEAVAETGSISNTIIGTGNLELGDTTAVTIPSGIVVDQVLVENGDQVKQGDVLATVNEDSVASAMVQVQDQIQKLEDEIAETQEDSEETKEIDSEISGRVKRIYIQEGSDTQETIAEYGALILLSLDGKLAVDLTDRQELAKGDTVTICRADGSEEEGTVESVSGTSCTITLTDAGVGIEETVTIQDENGNELGNGTTYIHQQMAVTAAGGTVEEIYVSEDEAIDGGDTLFTLNTSQSASVYQDLLTQQQNLTEILRQLSLLAENGVITATQDGIVDAVNVTGNSETASESEETVQASAMVYTANEGENYSEFSMQESSDIILLSGESDESILTDEESSLEEQKEKLQIQIASEGTAGKNMLVLEPPQTEGKPQTTVSSGDTVWGGTVVWEPADDSFASGTIYQAQVTLSAGGGYYFSEDSILGIDLGVISGLTVSEDGKNLQFIITYPETETSTEETDGNTEQSDTDSGKSENDTEDDADQDSQISDSAGSAGNTDTPESDQNNGGSLQSGGFSVENTDEGYKNQSGSFYTGGTDGGSSGQSSSVLSLAQDDNSSASESQENLDSSESFTEVTAFTIATEENMVMTVSVDELDINSVALEQEAEITLDAIEGEIYEGKVTKINHIAAASGGVAKYNVEITLSKNDQMKAGMNASATIVVEERENVVMIPVSALQEEGNQVFVYTDVDEEGNLSGKQEVTTGLSDGENVEITEGLSEGDKVYYQNPGAASSGSGDGSVSEFSEDIQMPDFGDFDMGSMPEMGNMDGGQMNMPSQEGR